MGEAYATMDAAGIDPNFSTDPEGIQRARADYDSFKAEFPDRSLPPFMEDDPYGWRPTTQRSRLIQARKLAAGRKNQYGTMPGDDALIPGVDYIGPGDAVIAELAEALRLRAENEEADAA
jgi:hypothetical protein